MGGIVQHQLPASAVNTCLRPFSAQAKTQLCHGSAGPGVAAAHRRQSLHQLDNEPQLTLPLSAEHLAAAFITSAWHHRSAPAHLRCPLFAIVAGHQRTHPEQGTSEGSFWPSFEQKLAAFLAVAVGCPDAGPEQTVSALACLRCPPDASLQAMIRQGSGI